MPELAERVSRVVKAFPSRWTLVLLSLWLAILSSNVGPDHPLSDLTPWMPRFWQVVFFGTAFVLLVWALFPSRVAANASFILLVVSGSARALSALLLMAEPQLLVFASWALVLTLWWEVWPSLVLDTLRDGPLPEV